MQIKNINEALIKKQDLSRSQMRAVMSFIMQGKANEVEIAALLVALRCKGEVLCELLGAVDVMLGFASKVTIDQKVLLDTCGTGGDGKNIMNVSTASAFVLASLGVKVAKHGNRGVSSSCGSADVLEQGGVQINLQSDNIKNLINKCGLAFMFAPIHHPAMKYVAPIRQKLKMRTIFNLLGPLVNPANTRHQVIGVFDRKWQLLLAQAARELNKEHVLVVHSSDGLDEFSINASTSVSELKNGEINNFELNPEELGIKRMPLDSLVIKNPQQGWELLTAALQGRHEAASEIVSLNSAAALYVAGKSASIKEGVLLARQAIANGSAIDCLNKYVIASNDEKENLS